MRLNDGSMTLYRKKLYLFVDDSRMNLAEINKRYPLNIFCGISSVCEHVFLGSNDRSTSDASKCFKKTFEVNCSHMVIKRERYAASSKQTPSDSSNKKSSLIRQFIRMINMFFRYIKLTSTQ